MSTIVSNTRTSGDADKQRNQEIESIPNPVVYNPLTDIQKNQSSV